jgi:hypothetical protein
VGAVGTLDSRGHSQPINAMIVGGAPTGIAHAVKIDPTKTAETTTEVMNGQMLAPAISSLY